MSGDERSDLRDLRLRACSHEDVRNSAKPDRSIADRLSCCPGIRAYGQVVPPQRKSRKFREIATIHGPSPQVPITIAQRGFETKKGARRHGGRPGGALLLNSDLCPHCREPSHSRPRRQFRPQAVSSHLARLVYFFGVYPCHIYSNARGRVCAFTARSQWPAFFAKTNW